MKQIEYKKCKNPLGIHEHYILPCNSKTNFKQKEMERYGYCAVCASRAFEDNTVTPNIPNQIHKPQKNVQSLGHDEL